MRVSVIVFTRGHINAVVGVEVFSNDTAAREQLRKLGYTPDGLLADTYCNKNWEAVIYQETVHHPTLDEEA